MLFLTAVFGIVGGPGHRVSWLGSSLRCDPGQVTLRACVLVW